jgi:hypothetical protein
VLLILGGAVRLIADKATFQSFLIGELWSPHQYSIYIYRILGAFVVFTGVMLMVISQDVQRYAKILKVWSGGFFFIGVVMFIAGLVLGLSFVHYAPDFIFCFIVAITAYVTAR